VEKFWECDKSIPSKCNPICGDGVVVTLEKDIVRFDNQIITSETCDDGNKTDGYGCKEDCRDIMTGF